MDFKSPLEEAPGSPISWRARQSRRVLKALEQLSQEYGLANRAMSLVAVIKRKTAVADEVPKTVVVPVSMGEDVAFPAEFARAMPQAAVYCLETLRPMRIAAARPMPAMEQMRRSRIMKEPAISWLADYAPTTAAPESADSEADQLVELAGRMESDGGLSGSTEEERWLAR